MLYEIEKYGDKLVPNKQFIEKSASELGIKEKSIENWIAAKPELLFPNEVILVIGQSVSGQKMADVLALDSSGNLIIIEIKRDWSDRETVGQLLSYAAHLQGVTYERLNIEAQRYSGWQGGDLLTAFREFIENEDFPREDIGKTHRLFIVAPDSDQELKSIVTWLRYYGLPIQFIPFSLFADKQGDTLFMRIEGVDIGSEGPEDTWADHWIFNTNETYAPGAYERMFALGVIAIYGYPNGPRNLMRGASEGEKVLAYVNNQGIRALGIITDAKVREGKGIFLDKNGKQQPDEYHIKVKWDYLLPKDRALSNREASSMGYNLPFRTVFGQLHKGKHAEKLVKEIIIRSQE